MNNEIFAKNMLDRLSLLSDSCAALDTTDDEEERILDEVTSHIEEAKVCLRSYLNRRRKE